MQGTLRRSERYHEATWDGTLANGAVPRKKERGLGNVRMRKVRPDVALEPAL